MMTELSIVYNGEEIGTFSKDEVIHLISSIYEHAEVMEGGHIEHKIMCKGCENIAIRFQQWLAMMMDDETAHK